MAAFRSSLASSTDGSENGEAKEVKLNTNLKGRLRNTALPFSKGLMPLFEAVANSIHAIEDAVTGSQPYRGEILVQIERDPQAVLKGKNTSKRESLRDISSFLITDNGIGFNEANMNSF